MPATWKRYEELHPDELAEIVTRTPVAYWPLGLLEHHGWHLPIGFDGLKADRICQRFAERTGGVILPTMWWGWGGGHDPFKWTHYQEESVASSVLTRTVEQLLACDFRVILLLAGHYPWRAILDEALPPVAQAHPTSLLLWGTEVDICGDAVPLRGDHAAREETSFGLALFPDLVDLEALTPGRGDDAWPGGNPPPLEGRHPGVSFDPADPLFAQMGEDSRTASAAHGEEGLARVVDHMTEKIAQFLR